MNRVHHASILFKESMCALLFQIRALVSTAEEVGLRDPSPG